ncbi:MAG: efflux RND transporter permease subunit [Candidatus Latescibacteria bacterium]|nr:efflux RND transporter permease subunit [Candidatus Latescibacterota bacterium]
MFLSDTSIRRPVFATMMMVALLVLGLFSYRRLNIDLFPEVSFPVVSVQTVYPGASPEAVEREVTKRIEEAVNTVQGVKEITSTSLEGLSSIIIMFNLEVNDKDAAQDVRSKIEQIRAELPIEIETPLVQRFDPSQQPIMSIAIQGEGRSIRDLTTLADQTVARRLKNVPGVGQVTVVGGAERAVLVYLDPKAMAALSVSVNQVMQALSTENVETPAGKVTGARAEQLVRVTGRMARPDEFASLIVVQRGTTPIRLGQVARIVDGEKEPKSLALFNGGRTVSLDILKVSKANTVVVAERVKEAVAELNTSVPAGVSARVIVDNSVYIRDSVEDVQTTLVLGAILTVMIVYIFLNSWRSTVITGLTLPVSVISAFIAIYAFGFTLNMMTLMALSLAIGILIDDAIVVRENIVRHVEMGEDHYTAARHGTNEIGLAVMATTFSILGVFIPVAFMGGIVGRFFYQFGITVAFAVTVSLFVSFTLDPMLSSVWYDPEAEGHKERGRFGKLLERFNGSFDRLGMRYRGVIAWALDHRWKTLGLAAAAFIGALLLFPFVGGQFVPVTDDGETNVTFKTPVGSTLEYTRKKAAAIDALLRGYPEVAYTYTTIGSGLTGQVNEGVTYVKLLPKARRTRSQQDMERLFRSDLSRMASVQASVLAGGFGGPQKPLQINVRGPQIEELKRISDEILAAVKRVPGAIEAESGLEKERPELRVTVDRALAADLGLGIRSVAQMVRPLVAGQTVTTWEDPTGEEYDVVVQVPPEARQSAEDLAQVPITVGRMSLESGTLATAPLSHLARIETGLAPPKIERRKLARVVTVAANYSGRPLTDVSGDIEAAIAKMSIPPGYSVSLGGETQDFRETVGFILESLILAVIFIYIILASQFGAFLQPLAIMLSLPLSLIGVMVALLTTRDTFNIMSMIGVIMLMGLVTKNAILLIDFANQARERGADRREALIDAGEIRLRPIVMTTLAMIFGMLPLALAIGSGAEFRAPMARAVIGGLITSTLLTLVIVPVAYTILDDVGHWAGLKFAKAKPHDEPSDRRARVALGVRD